VLTRDQGESLEWLRQRRLRITASIRSSKFGEICKATDRKNMESLVASIISPAELTGQAIMHGRKYERVAREQFK
jgi:hypothetical protein